MLCQMCHKNLSTVRFAEVVNGKVSDVHLCADCLAKHQENDTSGFGLASGAVPAVKNVTLTFDSSVAQRSCGTCGAELAEVLQTGRVGCTVCYESFGDALEKLLREIHVSLVHRGKIPRQTDSRAQVRADLHKKRAMLRSSLKLENYEEAATLRDAIKSLEQTLGAMEPGRQ